MAPEFHTVRRCAGFALVLSLAATLTVAGPVVASYAKEKPPVTAKTKRHRKAEKKGRVSAKCRFTKAHPARVRRQPAGCRAAARHVRSTRRTKDTVPPSVPQNLTAATGSGQVSLSWSASSDNVGVTGYYVYRGGVRIANVAGTGYGDSGLTSGVSYSYAVSAYDAAGNVSAQSSPVTAAPTASATPVPASGFVTRSGQQLLLNGSPYRFTGFNLWRANITSWNQPPNSGYDLNDGTALDTTLKDINANGGKMNVVRAWFMQQFALHNGAHDGAYDWSAFDKTLQVAQADGFKVIAALDDQWSYETDGTDTGSGWLPSTWYQSGYKTGPFTPYEYYSYRQYVHDVVTRYKNNPAILGWELVNEPEVATSDGVCVSNSEPILASFVSDVGGLIKSIDPNHLVSLGASGNGMCGTTDDNYQTVMSDPSIDLCSFHDYYGPTNVSAYNQWNGLNVRVQQCATLNKPVYIGEMGIHANASPCYGDQTCRGSWLSQKMNYAFNTYTGIVGYLPWQYDDRGMGSDDYDYGPGDPGLNILSTYAVP